MNIEELWKAHLEKASRIPLGPDSVEIEGEHIQIPVESMTMPIVKELPKDHFNTIIRWVKTTDGERLKSLRWIADQNMKRLGLKAHIRKAVKGPVPDGSDHFNSSSLSEWMARVNSEDEAAKAQIVAIHATIVARMGG